MHNQYLCVFTQSWVRPRKSYGCRYVLRKIPPYFNPTSGHTLRPVMFPLLLVIWTASVELFIGFIKMSGIPTTPGCPECHCCHHQRESSLCSIWSVSCSPLHWSRARWLMLANRLSRASTSHLPRTAGGLSSPFLLPWRTLRPCILRLAPDGIFWVPGWKRVNVPIFLVFTSQTVAKPLSTALNKALSSGQLSHMVTLKQDYARQREHENGARISLAVLQSVLLVSSLLGC